MIKKDTLFNDMERYCKFLDTKVSEFFPECGVSHFCTQAPIGADRFRYTFNVFLTENNVYEFSVSTVNAFPDYIIVDNLFEGKLEFNSNEEFSLYINRIQDCEEFNRKLRNILIIAEHNK